MQDAHWVLIAHVAIYENILLPSAFRDVSNSDGCFLPHHTVLCEDETTTKQRPVTQITSAKIAHSFSLNDRCLNGPTIQPEPFHFLIRWRVLKIVLVADVEEMYRQILMKCVPNQFRMLTYYIHLYSTWKISVISQPFLEKNSKIHKMPNRNTQTNFFLILTMDSSFSAQNT